MILVTGANGFLGSYICKKLHAEKLPFIAMVRPDSKIDLIEDIKDDITICHGDILDQDSLVPILEKVDVIIHCAAVVSYQASDKKMMDEVNITGTKNLVNLSLAYPIKYFVHISSVAALGRNTQSGTITEDNKWEYSKWNTHYGESKYLSELEVWRGVMEGLDAVIVNPSVILGPGNWSQSSSRIFKYVWDENTFYTEGVMNYIDVRDVADVVIKLLNKRVSGERYILNSGSITYKEFFDEVALKIGKKAPRIKATPLLIKLALVAESIKGLFSNGKPVITKETARVGTSKIYFNNTKIKSELNHNFVPLSRTIDWTCEFLLKEKS